MAISAVALLLVSCRSVEGTRGLPPFWEVYPTPSSLGRDVDVGGEETLFRPFAAFETREDGTRRLSVLLPLLELEEGPEGHRYAFLPFFRHQSRWKRSGGRDTDWMLFPFLFGGSDPDEGGYFAFFPFGGRWRGLLGAEETTFVLFPAWLRIRRGGRVSTHKIWPFFNTVRGAGWSGWRIWPFYGHYRKETEDGTPRHEHWFVLWPFWIRGKEHRQQDETDVFFSFPFYGHRISSRATNRTYLWPLLVTHHDERTDRWLVGGFLFPFRFAEGQFDAWPLFGWKSRSESGLVERDRARVFFLYPLVRHDRAEDRRESTTRTWVLPFFDRFYRYDKSLDREQERWRLWPFCRWSREGDEVAFDAIAPLWFDWEPFDRFYGRLFALLRWRSRADGSTAWEVLWGTIFWEGGPRETVLSLLGGLLEVGSREGRFRFRLLWVPWW